MALKNKQKKLNMHLENYFKIVVLRTERQGKKLNPFVNIKIRFLFHNDLNSNIPIITTGKVKV